MTDLDRILVAASIHKYMRWSHVRLVLELALLVFGLLAGARLLSTSWAKPSFKCPHEEQLHDPKTQADELQVPLLT